MTIFDHQRLSNDTFNIDIESIRRGRYSDKYFVNSQNLLTALATSNYRYKGLFHRDIGQETSNIDLGNQIVEMQIFTRRRGPTVVVGIDKALTVLRYCTGYFEGEKFMETFKQLDVRAIHDGAIVDYPPKDSVLEDNPQFVQPVMKICGPYRCFAQLETPILGMLSRSSRIATNVYQTLVAARGKPILFLPARFDAHENQAADGYAYNIAIQRFNYDYGKTVLPFICTEAQGDYWGGKPGATMPHAIIACFLGDVAATMLALASFLPVEAHRIALVDFNNNSVQDSLYTLDAMFNRFKELVEIGNEDESRKYILFGIRLDTSRSLRDDNIQPLGDPELDLGVNPRLVCTVREALNQAWERWNLPNGRLKSMAQEYCRNVKIIVSGGFNPKKIRHFEQLGVPVDYYGVGSTLMSNDSVTNTNNDFTADVVRIQIQGKWVNMAKIGRCSCDNIELEPVV